MDQQRRNDHYRDLLAHFPQLRTDDTTAAEILDTAAPFDVATFRAAIAMHRRERGRNQYPDAQRIGALLLRYTVNPGEVDSVPGRRIIDFLRARRRRPLDDFEYLTAHYRESWQKVLETATTTTAREIGQRMIFHDALKALREIGWPRDEAIAQARIWLDLPAEAIAV